MVTLTGGDLGATDDDNADPGLTFTVTNVANGQFELLGVVTTELRPGPACERRRDLRARRRRERAELRRRGLATAALTDGPSSATISFSANVNDAPVLGNNSLTVNEGQTVVAHGRRPQRDR